MMPMTTQAEQWEYYDGINDHGELVVTLVNLWFQDQSIVRQTHPWLVLLLVEHIGTEGVGGLAGVQSLITRSFASAANVEYVARCDRPKSSEFWFYSDRDYNPGSKVLAALDASAKVFVDVRADPEWTAYVGHLLPQTASQHRQVLNGKTMRELKRQGDRSDQPHTVTHLLEFRQIDDLAKCQSVLAKHGFSMIESKTVNGWIAAKFIQKLNPLSLQMLNEATNNLITLCAQCDGRYDGWETQVIGSKSGG
jgi:regulator of RNase E activity RraB